MDSNKCGSKKLFSPKELFKKIWKKWLKIFAGQKQFRVQKWFVSRILFGQQQKNLICLSNISSIMDISIIKDFSIISSNSDISKNDISTFLDVSTFSHISSILDIVKPFSTPTPFFSVCQQNFGYMSKFGLHYILH